MDCPLQLNADRVWQCPDCEWVYKPRRPTFLCRKPPRRNCPAKRTPEQIAEQEKQQAQLESDAIEAGKKLGWTAEDAKHWSVALAKWTAAGFPTRTDEEVEYIVWICEACDDYKADEQRCRICRCGVSTKGMAIFNKARLGTEHCDKAKW